MRDAQHRTLASRVREGDHCLERGTWRRGGRFSGDLFDERGKVIPREDGGFLPVLEGGATVDEPRGDRLAGELGAPVVEAGKEVGRDGLAGFDFHGVEGIRSGFDEGVDFVAFFVSEEMEGGLEAVIGLRLEDLGHDPVFKQGTALGVDAEVVGSAHADEPGSEPGIAEVELGRFDEALVEIGEPRADQKHQMAGLEYGQPGLGGDAGDAGVRRERGDVEKLADPPGTELDEALESGEILDVENLPHIPLQVGADVILKPNGGIDRAVMDRRKKTGMEQGVH